jgi:hypothetical protein
MNPEDAATGSGESSGRVLPLQYARSGIAEHGRFWAWAFLIPDGRGRGRRGAPAARSRGTFRRGFRPLKRTLQSRPCSYLVRWAMEML